MRNTTFYMQIYLTVFKADLYSGHLELVEVCTTMAVRYLELLSKQS